MKNRKKRILSFLLEIVCLFSLFPVGAFAADGETGLTARVSSETAIIGSTVAVKVSIENNPGMSSFKGELSFDESLLTLESIEYNAEFGGQFMQPQTKKSPVLLTWLSPLEDSAYSGTFATLTFSVAEIEEDQAVANLTMTFDPDDIYDMSETNIPLTVVNGSVTIFNGLPGDINMDQKVNNKDATRLFQYVAGWEVEADEAALDCNGDGKVNNKDATRLFQYVAGWDVQLYYGGKVPEKCNHTMEAHEAAAATCTEDGNTAYWYCTTCKKFFNDAAGTGEITLESTRIPATGHTEVTIPATDTMTEGKKCSVCGETLVQPQPIIDAGNEYTIQYMNDMVPSTDTRYYLQNNITDHFHYISGTEKALPTPQLDKYTFIGWSDASGNLVGGNGKVLPANTTGNIVLYANWVSNRNYATYVPKLAAPVTYEDDENGLILFQYKIGTINHIPLYTTLNLQCANGLITTVSQTNQKSIKNSNAKSVSETVAEETTNSASWTLSEDWNQSTSISQKTIDELNISEEDIEKVGKSDSGTYNVGTSYSHNTATVDANGSSVKLTGNKAHSSTTGTESGQNFGLSVDAKYEASVEAGVEGIAKAKAGYSIGVGVDYSNYGKNTSSDTDSWSNTAEIGTESSHSKTDSKTWNTNESYSTSSEISAESSYSKAISMATSLENGNTTATAAGGGKSTSEDYGVKDSKSSEYGSVVTFDNEEIETHYTSFSSNGETHGNYRMVMATSADVYAIVGYDIAKSEYFVYTYTVSNHNTEEYLDYSWDGTFNDYECSFLKFEVPYEVNEYVNARITQSEGLMINPSTGVVEAYDPDESWHDEIIYVPSYFRVKQDGEYRSVKVTGIADGIFKNNTDIKAVVLSSFITEIPDNAFNGCSSLQAIYCPGVTTIGNNAFNGCTSLESFTIPYEITSVGENAFVGVGNLNCYASDKAVAQAAASSGAKNITLNISRLTEEKNLEYVIGNIDSFTLEGNGGRFEGLAITSDARETKLDGVNIVGGKKPSLSVASPNLILDHTSISSNNVAVLLRCDEVVLTLNNENNLTSTVGKVIICKNLALAKMNTNLFAKLNLTGDILTCGDVGNDKYLSFTSGQKKTISEAEYLKYVSGFVSITLDANGGELAETTWNGFYGLPVGDLPTPTRNGYGFSGWYTAASGGTLVSENYAPEEFDITLYAHWVADKFTANWSTGTGYSIAVERTSSPNGGAATGSLSKGASVYYGDILNVTYTANTGYSISTKGKTSITVTGDVTSSDIFATAAVNKYTVNWNTGTGYAIEVKRTSSPNGGAATGSLSKGTAVYYGDVLNITYTANTGYSINTKGKTSITVTGNVTSTDIYATAAVNKYTIDWNTGTGYTIEVKRTSSPNGGAATGSLSKGAAVYYGDVLSVTYTPSTGYSISAKGKTSITVTGDVSANDIYASASVNNYKYNIVYKSSNGTTLDTGSIEGTYGESKTVSPKDFTSRGYNTPSSQKITWDKESKTITFTYTPTSQSANSYSGSYSGCFNYSATVSFRNRTSNSVQVCVSWSMSAYGTYWYYGQNLRATASNGASSVAVAKGYGSATSGSGSTDWITVPLSTTDKTWVPLSIYVWQSNTKGLDMSTYASDPAYGFSATWGVTVPAY